MRNLWHYLMTICYYFVFAIAVKRKEYCEDPMRKRMNHLGRSNERSGRGEERNEKRFDDLTKCDTVGEIRLSDIKTGCYP